MFSNQLSYLGVTLFTTNLIIFLIQTLLLKWYSVNKVITPISIFMVLQEVDFFHLFDELYVNENRQYALLHITIPMSENFSQWWKFSHHISTCSYHIYKDYVFGGKALQTWPLPRNLSNIITLGFACVDFEITSYKNNCNVIIKEKPIIVSVQFSIFFCWFVQLTHLEILFSPN